MTEAEWLACDDPEAMLAFLGGRTGDRKLLLFCAASFYLVRTYGDQQLFGRRVQL